MRTRRSNNTTADGGYRDDHERVASLYELYAPRLAAYALRRTSRTDAADAVAETFLVAWRRREQIPAEPMTLPWLYGVARRVLANQHRTHHRRSRLHDRLATQFTQQEPPQSRVEAAEGFERMGVALEKLSDTDAELLRLTAWECLSPTEIATVMGIEPEAVRQRLHRARKRLRKQLAVEHVDYRRRPQSRSVGASSAARPAIAAFLWELSE